MTGQSKSSGHHAKRQPRIGDLVTPRCGSGVVGVDYGVGLIIDIHEHSRGLRGRKSYVVQWHHEHQWWDDDELKFCVSQKCKSS